MSIDRTSPLKPVSTVQPRETIDAPVTNTRAAKTTASTSTSVTLSDAQAKLMQPGSSDINLCIDSLEVRKKPGGHWIIRDLMGLDLVGLASL